MFEVRMNTLEFHTWASRADKLEKPDVMVFDLDPDVGMDLSRINRDLYRINGILPAGKNILPLYLTKRDRIVC